MVFIYHYELQLMQALEEVDTHTEYRKLKSRIQTVLGLKFADHKILYFWTWFAMMMPSIQWNFNPIHCIDLLVWPKQNININSWVLQMRILNAFYKELNNWNWISVNSVLCNVSKCAQSLKLFITRNQKMFSVCFQCMPDSSFLSLFFFLLIALKWLP